MIIEVNIIGHKICQEFIEGSTKFMLWVSTPMDSFFINGKIDQVFYVLKDQRLTYKLIIRDQCLNDILAGIQGVKALLYGRRHCWHFKIIFQWSIYDIFFTFQGFLSSMN